MVAPEKFNDPLAKRPRVLLAPLDWGLGHATRCVPIIKELLNNKCEVLVASSGAQKALLEEEFPFLTYIDLSGYNIRYAKNRYLTQLKLILDIPKILIRIKQEKKWLERLPGGEMPDIVISDNRYGLYTAGIFSVFITHQLSIKTPFGRIADSILRRFHYRMIRRFSCCWVPDKGQKELSFGGELSHPAHLPSISTRYIGPLSRFSESLPASRQGSGSRGSSFAKWDLLILLSGPEPQRSFFEQQLLEQSASFPGKTILVRGLPGAGGNEWPQHLPDDRERRPVFPETLTVFNHLPAGELNTVLDNTEIVISRSGYSTIMDLLTLRKKAIFVPTPGQTEQEYLGEYLHQQRIALCIRQKEFELQKALTLAGKFPYADPSGGLEKGGADGLLRQEVRSLLENWRAF